MQRVTAAKVGSVSALDLVTRRQTAFKTFGEFVEASLDSRGWQPSLECRVRANAYADVSTLVSVAQNAAECCVLADAFDETMRKLKRTSRVVRI